MKMILILFAFGLASPNFVWCQDAQDGRSSTKERTAVERKLLLAIGMADINWDYQGALKVVRSLYGRADADQRLVLRAETALCAAQAANRLDTWEGSDFGKATPWTSTGMGTLWTDWKKGEDGSITGKPREDISIEYFDMIIDHSLKRLRSVSASAAESADVAEHLLSPD